MEKFKVVLNENVLTDDVLVVLEEGYVYKGRNGACVKVVYYTYADPWFDKEHVIYAKTIDNAIKRYEQAKKHKVDDDIKTDIECLMYA